MKIVSKFARGIVSKILKKVISKKSGYDVDIQLNAITVTISEGTGHLHLDMDAEMEKDELVKLLKSIGLD